MSFYDDEEEDGTAPVLARAQKRIRLVKDDPDLKPEHKKKLDYSLMLLLHHELGEGECTLEQSTIIQEFQQDIIDKWDYMDMRSKKSLRVIVSLEEKWAVRMRSAMLYDLSSCVCRLSRRADTYTEASPDARLEAKASWAEIQKIITDRLGLRMLQIPCYL